MERNWDALTHEERREVMKRYRAEWIKDVTDEIAHYPDNDGLLAYIRNMLLRSENPHIVY